MKFTAVFFILLVAAGYAFAADVMVKYPSAVSGYKDAVPELGLYLFAEGQEPDGFLYKEANSSARIQGTDPLKNRQSYLKKLRLDSVSVKTSQNVAIIDTGVAFSHPDLRGHGDQDVNGHGTAVAGIISAVQNNGIGIRGVADANLMSFKAFNKNGDGKYFNIIKAIVNSVKEQNRIIVIAAGGIEYSQALKEACEYASLNKAVIIAAGGNTNSEKLLYPAAFKDVISVGSLNNEGNRCDFNDWGYDADGKPRGSCYGKDVDFMLPGVNIFSSSINGGYAYFKGTSYSAAICAGIAAYILGNEPDISNTELKAKIKEFLDFGPEYVQSSAAAEIVSYKASSVTPLAVDEPEYKAMAAEDYSSYLTVSRDFSKNSANPGENVDVTITITNNRGEAIRGFYFTEQVSNKVTVVSGDATLNGSPITIKYEKDAADTVYSGYTPHRFVLETPPDFSENNSFPASGVLIIKYSVSSDVTGFYYFDNYSWVGQLQDSEKTSIFAYETGGSMLEVVMPSVYSAQVYPTDYIFTMDPQFKWANAGDGYTYELYVYQRIGTRLKLLYSNLELSTNTFNWADSGKDFIAGKVYQWKVRPVINGIKGAYMQYKFMPFALEIPYIDSPAGNISSTAAAPNFTFTTVTGADHYKINVFQKSGAKYVSIGEKSVSASPAAWADVVTDTAFKAGSVYKWTVTAYNADETSASKTEQAIFAYYSIGAPELVAPVGEVQELQQTFSWNAPTGSPAEYNFYLYKKVRGKYVLDSVNSQETTGTSVTVTLAPNQYYMWKVIGQKMDGDNLIQGATAVAYCYTKVIEAPAILAPASITDSLKPKIQWSYNATSDEKAKTSIHVQVKLGTAVKVDEIISATLTEFDLAAGDFEMVAGSKYAVMLRAEVTGGVYSGWTKKVVTAASTESLTKPVITKPAKKEFLAALSLDSAVTWQFRWEDKNAASKYNILIKQGTSVVYNQDVTYTKSTVNRVDGDGYITLNIITSEAVSAALVDGKKYTIQVCGVDTESNKGPYSAAVPFYAQALGDVVPESPEGKVLYLNPAEQSYAIFEGFSMAPGTQKFRLYKKVGTRFVEQTSDWTAFDQSNGYVHYWGDQESETPLVHNAVYKFMYRSEKTVGTETRYSRQKNIVFKACSPSVPVPYSPGLPKYDGYPIFYQIISSIQPEFMWRYSGEYSYFEILIIGGGKRLKLKNYGDGEYSPGWYKYKLSDAKLLKPNAKYKWSIRAIREESGKKQYSPWSDKRYFETSAVDSPYPVSPAYFETLHTTRPVFKVKIDPRSVKLEITLYYGNATDYKFKPAKKFRVPITNITESSGSYYTEFVCPVDLKSGKSYGWKVRTQTLNTWSASSAEYSIYDYYLFNIAEDINSLNYEVNPY